MLLYVLGLLSTTNLLDREDAPEYVFQVGTNPKVPY